MRCFGCQKEISFFTPQLTFKNKIMKLTRLLHLLAAFLMLFTVSCTSEFEEIIPQLSYNNTVIISNEGGFNKNNASVGAVTRDLQTGVASVYAAANNNESLGDVLQSVGFNGTKAYLVLNNSNKVVIVDRSTFKKQGEITNQIHQPRYIAFSNDYIYVTNYDYGTSKYVSIYKISDLSYVNKITLTDAAQRVVNAGGNIFVENASDGFGNKIAYIKGSDNTLQSDITLPNGNLNKIVAYNSKVYAIASGTTDSYIYEISNTGNITSTTTLTGIPNANKLDIAANKFYFTSANKVYTMDMGSTTVPNTPLFSVTNVNQYSTLYGFNVVDGKIFTSEANGFTANSTISVYSLSGTLIKTFEGGIGTNGFYANY